MKAIKSKKKSIMDLIEEMGQQEPWSTIQPDVVGQKKFYNKASGLFVSAAQHKIGEENWILIRVGRKSKAPSYRDCVIVVRHFLGDKSGAFISIQPSMTSYDAGTCDLDIWTSASVELFQSGRNDDKK